VTIANIDREFVQAPTNLIDEPALASRTEMDDAALDELARSIRQIGLQQPIGLARVGPRFEVIYGHRRFLACRMAGIVAIPAMVYPSKSDGLMAAQYAENRYREDLNPADEALLFAELLEQKCGGDTDRLCELIGEKREYVEGRLVLLRDPLILEAVRTKQLKSVGVARELLKITDEGWRKYYLEACVRGGATVAVASSFVQQWKTHYADQPQPPNQEAQNFVPVSVAASTFFTCVCCGGTEDPHMMETIAVHRHCRLAILNKLLAAYRGEA